MAERVTLRQVAEAAGVSVMTVSNVLNGKPGASAETRERIREVAERQGYVPNMSARGLKSGRTGMIGVVVRELNMRGYGLEILRGIADEVAVADLELLISTTYHDVRRERSRLEHLTRGVVDGLLLVAPVLDEQTIELLRSRRCPLVVIDPRRLDLELPRVTVDNYGGMRLAAQHLIDLGHRRIGYIGGEPTFESSAVRYSGFLDAMKLAELPVSEELIVHECDFDYTSGFDAASRLISNFRPTAIIAGADLIALGVLDAARAQGLTVPLHLSVVGFDDLPLAAESFPGLTSVRQPLYDMGQVAVRTLLSSLDGSPPLVERMQLLTSLIVRATTAAPLQQRSIR